MINLSEAFKKHKLTISLACVLTICVIGGMFLAKPNEEQRLSLDSTLATITLENYPHSSAEAIENFKEYVRAQPSENATLILNDKELVYGMLMDSYWVTESSSANNVNLDLNDYEALTEEYLTPLALSSITATTWSNADEILPHRFGLFYVAKKTSADSFNSTNWDTTPFDAEEVESLVKNYFDISSEYLRSSDYYDADSSSYTFESLGGATSFKVVDAKLNDQKLLLSYEYYSPADEVTVIREGVLTIMLGEHSYKYVSCSTD